MVNNTKKQQLNVVSLLFWVYILVALLVLIIGSILILSSNSEKYQSYEDLDQLVGEHIFPEQDGTKNNDFYVIFYTRSTEDNIYTESSRNSTDVEPIIMKYANYYNDNYKSDITENTTFALHKIYAVNLDLQANRPCITTDGTKTVYNASNFESLHVYQKMMPVLIHFTNGSVTRFSSSTTEIFGAVNNNYAIVEPNAISNYLTKVIEKTEEAKVTKTTESK